MSDRLEPRGDDAEELVRDMLHETLREAVHARRSGRSAADAIRRRTRTLCDCARAHGYSIERVLVTLKQEWREAPETRHLPRPEAKTVLERMVTLCIDEYYAERSPPH